MLINEEHKSTKCPNCPYYNRVTSYGREWIECGNTDCIHYGSENTKTNEKMK